MPDAGNYLSRINSPDDLKKFKAEELPAICAELRQYIIDVVSKHPGHFGSSLGVVELTVALHYVYNTPYDQLVWDVLTATRFSPAAATSSRRTGCCTAFRVSQNAARVSTTHLAQGTHQPQYQRL